MEKHCSMVDMFLLYLNVSSVTHVFDNPYHKGKQQSFI
jgi:hypothetical protein